MKVYLDYAATSPIKNEVKKEIEPYFTSSFGNPSSIHAWGRDARKALDNAREQVAKFLNAEPKEIVFTSGGTEADNLAIRGLISTQKNKSHIITSQIEHHAVIRTCEDLEKEGKVEVTYLKPNREGIIETEKVRKALKKNTVLVTIMYVNNEVGTVQPIRDIGKMIEKENKQRLKLNQQLIYFHTDAVQASEYFNMDVDYLHVNLLTISGHKIGAPKGIGALYVGPNTPLKEIIFGGEQEMGLRAGTENVAGIVALGKATEILNDNYELRFKKISEIRDYFINKVKKEIDEVELNGSKDLRSPNNVNLYFKYIEGESILLNLDLVGIAASSGSACTSQSLSPSHVLLSLYDNPERAHGSIRFTLGESTTKNDIDYTVKELVKIVKKLRNMSPLYPSTKLGTAKG